MAKSSKPAIFKGPNGDRNLLIAIALAGAVGVYLYKKKQEAPKVAGSLVSGVPSIGVLPAYAG